MGKRESRFGNILITGASSGIGRALALSYAMPGHAIAICGRDPVRLEEVADDLRDRGALVIAEVLDVQDRSATARWIASFDAAHPIGLVIANAGISAGTGGDGGESDEQVRDIFAVNLAGTLNTVLPAAELMKSRRSGQIALMSSLAGFRGMPSAPAYAASKAAVRSWGEGLRGQLAEFGIGVSVICPGFVESRITERNRFPMPFLMSAEKAAVIITRGLERNKARIAFPWPTYWIAWLLGVLPPVWTESILRRAPKKAQLVD